MNEIDICRRHFKNIGYKGKYNQKILDYIAYKFDLFSKDGEILVVYILKKEDSLASLVDVAKIIGMERSDLKICLCIPEEFSLPLGSHKKVFDYNIDLYIIKKDGHIESITKGLSKKIFEELSLDEIKKIILNINRIFKFKWEFHLFKFRGSLLEMPYLVNNKSEFVLQISAISSILESINFKDIKNHLKSKVISKREEEALSGDHSISIIELFLKKEGISYDPSLIKNMRELRDLRGLQPIHSAEAKFRKICRKLIKKIPQNNSDWTELGQIALAKFKGSLILLRNVLK